MIYLLLTGIILFLASFIKSITGFGFALVLVPLLNLIFSPKISVPFDIILAGILNIILLIQCYRNIEINKITYLLIGSIIGLPFGAYILSNFDEKLLTIFISLITIILSILLSINKNIIFRENRSTLIGIGFISGGMGSSTGMSGPPIILLGLAQKWDKEKFRSNLIGYFTFINILTILIYMNIGIFTSFIIQLAIIEFPIILLGIFIGNRLKKKVSQKLFHKIALILVISASISKLIINLS